MSLTIIMLQRFAMEHHESRLREPEHFIRDENKCTVIYLCPCVFFRRFLRDLNEAKAVYRCMTF